MRAAIRTTNPKRRTASLCSEANRADSSRVPESGRALHEASLRSVLSLFELLDRWDLEAKSREA